VGDRRIRGDWLQRRDVAKRLGVSYARVRGLEREGQLVPKKDRAGVWRFDPVEVATLAEKSDRRGRSSAGELAARVAELDAEGKTAREIVCLLRVSPELVRRLRAELAEPDAWVIPAADVRALRALLGETIDGAHLVRAVSALVRDARAARLDRIGSARGVALEEAG